MTPDGRRRRPRAVTVAPPGKVRVIAGVWKGRRLSVPHGLDVRPTPNRLRQALFSTLLPKLAGARFWDVCAGTGAIGIEALSRGAREVVFSESDRAALAVLTANLALVGATAGQHRVFGAPWQRVAAMLHADAGFDVIYYDPPWNAAEFEALAPALRPRLRPGGLLSVEHPRGTPPAVPAGFTTWRRLNSGGASVSIFMLAAAEMAGTVLESPAAAGAAARSGDDG